MKSARFCWAVTFVGSWCALQSSIGCSGASPVDLDHQEVAISQRLPDIDRPVDVWARTVIEHPDGTTEERFETHPDQVLVARLAEITAPNFLDPNVDVALADFGWSDENGGWTHGTKVRLTPRSLAEPNELGAPLRHARPRSRPAPTPEQILEADLEEVRTTGEEDLILLVELSPEPALAIPDQRTSPIPPTALEAFELMLRREEAMVARGEEVVALQQPFVEWLEGQGGVVLVQLWLHNWLYARVPLALAPSILGRPEVVSAEYARPSELAGNVQTMDVQRDKMQTQDFLDAFYDGGQTSSRNPWGIWLSILEPTESLDLMHPGLNDWWDGDICDDALADGVPDDYCRVKAAFDCEPNSGDSDCEEAPCPECAAGLDPCTWQHGLRVFSVAAADFMDGQVPGLSSAERSQRSGHAQEASLLLMTDNPWCLACGVEELMEQNADITTHSAGTTGGSATCNPSYKRALMINDAFDDGILWFNAMRNLSNCGGSACDANTESAAAGSIALGQYDATAVDLDSATICQSSAGGAASWGPVADMLAPGCGRYLMECGNTEVDCGTSGCGGTSIASPQAAGASALLMDHWIADYSDATAHQPGRMHAVLLNMGDTCGSSNDIHPDWGAGRLKMRMYNAAGLDSPWYHTTTSFTFTSGVGYNAWPAYPDAQGVNQPIPTDVDALSAATFCYYAGFDYSSLPTMTFRFWNTDTVTGTYAADTLGEKAIVRVDPTNHRYEIRLSINGLQVGETVKCWVNWIWEDSDRDDGDGLPAGDIDAYPVPGDLAPTCDNAC